MTRLELVYPMPHPSRAERLDHAVRQVMQDREPANGFQPHPVDDTRPYFTSTTTCVRVWILPNRRIARVSRRHLLEAFKECGEPEPGVSITSVRGRRP